MSSESFIPEELVPQILEKAGQLYQNKHSNEGYSLEELMVAGSEAHIPPELVKQAYRQIQQKQSAKARQARKRRQQIKRGGAIAASLGILMLVWVGMLYNSLVSAKQTVQGQWAQVENQLQRRADLIPQLTQLAESYLNTEVQLIQRLKETQTNFLQADSVQAQQAANEEMKAAIAQFQSFAARQPTLQSNQLFINLQFEIAGTENRIATERMRYNQAVQTYNQSVNRFPVMLLARPLGFKAQRFYGEVNDRTSLIILDRF